MDDNEFEEEYDYEDSADCWHDDYDADILTGEAWCWRCGAKWLMTSREISQEIRHQAEYMASEEDYATSTPKPTNIE